MATQSTPTVVDFECQATTDLTTLPHSALSNGCRAWVSAGGSTQGLWCLNNQNADPIGPGVVATSDGIGRWIFFGAGGFQSRAKYGGGGGGPVWVICNGYLGNAPTSTGGLGGAGNLPLGGSDGAPGADGIVVPLFDQ